MSDAVELSGRELAELMAKLMSEPALMAAIGAFMELGTNRGPKENVVAGAIVTAIQKELCEVHSRRSGGAPSEWSDTIFDLSKHIVLLPLAGEDHVPVTQKGGDA